MSTISTGAEVVTDWTSENGNLEDKAMDLWALRRAVVLLIVRRWCGTMSCLSSEATDSISESGMSSCSSFSPSSSNWAPPSAWSISDSDSEVSLSSSLDVSNCCRGQQHSSHRVPLLHYLRNPSILLVGFPLFRAF